MTYRYDYDAAGNINEVYRQLGSGTLDFLSSYEYDKLGQLTKATDSRGTETFTYDTAGNIRSRTLGGETVEYSYDNPSWNDLLTAYDGQKIAYEGQTYNASGNTVSGTVVSGNPVSYYNGNRWDMEWTNGSQLAEASSNDTVVSYTYDRAGLRATKTVDGTTYHYAYVGDKLVWQEWDGNELFFFYDETNAPVGFWYHPASGSNVTGYYMTTQQGDITRIEDVNGNVLATYEYDAWGKLISSSGSLADINPLRYRGYYFDTETGFYYLQSRYYDPVVSRFINADRYASTGRGLLSYNMFAYCQNNPVNYSDPSGEAVNSRSMLINDGCSRSVLVGGALSGIKAGVDAVNRAHRGDNDVPFYGEPGSRVVSPDGTKERVYGPDGRPSRDRHYTDHGNPKKHPYVPHDHDWKTFPDGKWKPDEGYPSPDGPLSPIESFIPEDFGSNVTDAATFGVAVIVLYEVVKWSIAICAAPVTGGTSLGGAALVP